ncbi:hypothetical protein EG328_010540 [Venturia inaequalis]|uniref:SGNH hydrolase-type esterase domain-containing protein n=1 Tax=Venturia inaequalis TaxID=5025 RepID=A0A8H3VHF8_VENIN|nr:hypothetical protein EG328_010540 [Venturia inaequalis]
MHIHPSTTLLLSLQALTATATQLQYASLGSSYAAGPGLPTNYPHLIATALSANLTDLAVSGSLLKDISSQIARIPSNANIVTLTSGGNDLSYVAGLMAHVAPAQTVTASELTKRFTTALEAIHSIAPKATVYLVEYLTMLSPSFTKPVVDVPFNSTEITKFEAVFSTLKEVTGASVKGREGWVVVVPVSEKSVGHALGSKETLWVNGASVPSGAGGIPWHPNTVGTQFVADLAVASIKARIAG